MEILKTPGNESRANLIVVERSFKALYENLDFNKTAVRVILISLAIILGVLAQEIKALLLSSTFVELTKGFFQDIVGLTYSVIIYTQYLFLSEFPSDMLQYLNIAVKLIGKIIPVHDKNLLLPILINGTLFYLYFLKVLLENSQRRDVDVRSFI